MVNIGYCRSTYNIRSRTQWNAVLIIITAALEGLGSVTAELLVVVLTWIKTSSALRALKAAGVKRSLTQLLLRDGECFLCQGEHDINFNSPGTLWFWYLLASLDFYCMPLNKYPYT